MTGTTPIRVQNLTKKFCRSLRRSMLYGVRDVIRELADRPMEQGLREDEFYALDGIDFEVGEAECLGVIGPNGSGKSTLLKLLTGIYPPDVGTIHIAGRVAALIEVGAGFHPLQTGRENIFISGAILGMRRAEIRRRLDEIVAFSGLESFIDAPVKNYSSGMYVRLGFSIMAHLEPAILFMDEVLAVGDVAFRIKSMNKVREMARLGTACIVVTHDLYQVSALCNRAMVLDRGKQVFCGAPQDAVSQYLELMRQMPSPTEEMRYESGLRFAGITFNGMCAIADVPAVESFKELVIRVEYQLERHVANGIQVGFLIKNAQGHNVTGFTTNTLGHRIAGTPGRGSVALRLARNPLLAGYYSLSVSVFDGDYKIQLAGWQYAAQFRVVTPDFSGLLYVGDILPSIEIVE
jgi:lipopolysaccharide transport system ATP-binding protein